MRKKSLLLLCIVTVASTLFISNKISHTHKTSNLFLQNVEALCNDGESSDLIRSCYVKISSNEHYGELYEATYCGDCLSTLITKGWGEKTCRKGNPS